MNLLPKFGGRNWRCLGNGKHNPSLGPAPVSVPTPETPLPLEPRALGFSLRHLTVNLTSVPTLFESQLERSCVKAGGRRGRGLTFIENPLPYKSDSSHTVSNLNHPACLLKKNISVTTLQKAMEIWKH